MILCFENVSMRNVTELKLVIINILMLGRNLPNVTASDVRITKHAFLEFTISMFF